jgi:hypothetical protein
LHCCCVRAWAFAANSYFFRTGKCSDTSNSTTRIREIIRYKSAVDAHVHIVRYNLTLSSLALTYRIHAAGKASKGLPDFNVVDAAIDAAGAVDWPSDKAWQRDRIARINAAAAQIQGLKRAYVCGTDQTSRVQLADQLAKLPVHEMTSHLDVMRRLTHDIQSNYFISNNQFS